MPTPTYTLNTKRKVLRTPVSLQTVSLVISLEDTWFAPRNALNGYAGGQPTRLEPYKMDSIINNNCYKTATGWTNPEMQLLPLRFLWVISELYRFKSINDPPKFNH